MPTFTYSELAEDLGTATADGLRNLANTAANAVCSAWADYAAATAGFPDPTGLGAFNNAMFSRLCAPRGVTPPEPEEAFIGGQCPILYNVNVSIGSARPNDTPATFPPNEIAQYPNILGPIRGGDVLPVGDSGKRGVFYAANQPGYPDGIITTWIAPTNSGQDDRFEGAFSQVVSVTPSNPAQPDECGNPPPGFPPIVPPKNTFNFPVNVDVGGLTLDLDLNFNPTIFSPQFAFKPEFNVGIGPFQIVFNPDGIDIFLSPDIDIGINLPPGLDPRTPQPPPKPPTGGDGSDCPDCICPDVDLQPVLELLEDIKDCTCLESDEESITIPDSTGDLVVVPTWIKRVVIDVTQVGEAVRSQLGNGGAPDVQYLGWYAFGVGAALGDRKPISFESSIFENKVETINSFSFSLNFDSVANVTVVYFKEPE